MITDQNDQIVVEPSGYVRVCAWCVPAKRIADLARAYRCTHALCDACRVKFEQESA